MGALCSRPHIELARAGILSTVMIKIKYNLILISCLINNSSCSCSGSVTCVNVSLSQFLLILIPCHDTGGGTGETRFRAQIWGEKGENCVNNLSRTLHTNHVWLLSPSRPRQVLVRNKERLCRVLQCNVKGREMKVILCLYCVHRRWRSFSFSTSIEGLYN